MHAQAMFNEVLKFNVGIGIMEVLEARFSKIFNILLKFELIGICLAS